MATVDFDLLEDIENGNVFKAHYMGDISEQAIDNLLKAAFGVGLGNNIKFDANGKLIEIDGITVETGSYSQTGTTATITHDGSEIIQVGDILNIIFRVGTNNNTPEVLTVTSVSSTGTGATFTVTRATSASIVAEIVSFYFEDVAKAGSYTQTNNDILVTHNGNETLNVGDSVVFEPTSGSATAENVQVTQVISDTQFVTRSSTSVTTSGDAFFTKQDKDNIDSGNVDGIQTTATSILSSKQSNNLIDVLSEGEITGFHSPVQAGFTRGTDKYNLAALKDVFLNGTQVLKNSADLDNLTEADFNFVREDISFEPRFGTSDQVILDTINEIESEVAVGVEVKKGSNDSTSKAGDYHLAGAGGDTNVDIGGATGVNLTANQMLIKTDAVHGFVVDDLILFSPDASGGGTAIGMEEIVVSVPANNLLVINTSVNNSHTTGACTIKESTGVSRSILSQIDKLRITIGFPSLQFFNTETGETEGTQVNLSIKITESNGTVHRAIKGTKGAVIGKTNTQYFRDYIINNLKNKSYPLTVTVTRVTNDSTDTNLQNKFIWTSFTKITAQRRAYPDVAHIGLRFNAESFRSIPTRTYRIKGIKVKIPSVSGTLLNGTFRYFNNTRTVEVNTVDGSGNNLGHGLVVGDFITIINAVDGSGNSISAINGFHGLVTTNLVHQFEYNVNDKNETGGNILGTLTYRITPNVDITDGRINYPTGYSFNGTLTDDNNKQFSSDPAWILYDLLTNNRYGASIPETAIDKFAFYSASVYNSTLVDNGSGRGTKEARFSCNANINNQKDAFELIQNLCSVMRAQAFYEAGSITISQDRPSDPVYTFNISNVLEGGFSYTNQSQKAKFTRINVGFFDMVTQEIDYETVDDTTAQSRYGIRTQTIKSFATTSRGQASRMGKWLLFNQNNSSEIVNFAITAEAGVLVRPGQIISIADEVKQGVRRGGRIKTGISTTEIEVDDTASTDLVTTNTAKLSVVLPNGTLETRAINGISGATVTVSSAFSQTPQANSVWVIENTTLEPTTWRVINVQEQENLTFSITAASHNTGKYDFVEDGTPLPIKTFTVLTKKLQAPTDLSFREEILVINNKAVTRGTIQFAAVKGAIGYLLQYKLNNSNEINQIIKSTEFSIDNITNGIINVKVSSINTINKISEAPNEEKFNITGKTALPADVQNLKVETISDNLMRLRFDKSTDIDVLHGGNVVVRHSNLTDGTGTFTNSVDLINNLPGNVSETILPAIDGEYILKFKDDGGRLSFGETSVVVVNPDPTPKLLVFNDREDTDSPPFAGTKSDCFFSDEVNGLVLGSTVTIDDAPDFDAIADFDFVGDVDFLTGGSYDFAKILDLGAVNPLRLTRHFVTQGFYPNDLIDKRTANIDSWTDFDAATAFNVNAKLLVATTTAAPSNGSSYQDSDFTGKTFNTFANGTYVGRGFKFRCLLESEDPAQSIEIDQLGYKAELDRRTEQKSNLSSGTSASGLAVTFDQAFFTGAAETSVGVDTQKPSIGITANDLAANERFEITNISGSGFTIKFIDASSNPVNKTFSFTAVGFGRGS